MSTHGRKEEIRIKKHERKKAFGLCTETTTQPDGSMG
jgi:hypothetical protein